MEMMKPFNLLAARFPGRNRQACEVADHTPERRQRRRLDARKGTKVLIIDDSDTAQSMIAKMFTTSGYVAMQCKDPELGLFMACFEHPDLVILDIGLPGMNGFEVLKRMRKDPLARRIPVIMVSGNPRSINIFRQSHVDADGFIKKPFARAEIFRLIAAMLNPDRVPVRPGTLRVQARPTLLQRLRRNQLRQIMEMGRPSQV
jgi:twitching motility two-component system response regulator PilH